MNQLTQSTNWGWTNGPYSPSTGSVYTFTLYVGAGQCVLSNGIAAGIVIVEYNANGLVTVQYSMYSGYTLQMTNLYVGKTMLPKTSTGSYTTAPGQFPYNPTKPQYKGNNMYMIQFASPLSPIYVSAHANVCY